MCAVQFTIPDMAGMTSNQAGQHTDTRSSSAEHCQSYP